MDPRAPAPRASPWFALLLLCGAACATTRQEVKSEPEGPEVVEIRIEGAENLSASEIKKKILTSEGGGVWPFETKAYFDPNAWQADLRRVERFYQAQGYYQAEVIEDEVILRDDNKVVLRLKVREGEPTRIGGVRLTGTENLPEDHQAAVRKGLELKEGEIFQEDDWAGQKATLQSILKELGYAEAAVEGEVHVDVQRKVADVLMEAKPGQRYRFGSIFVSTDSDARIRPKRIIDQAQGAIKPNGWYSESALAEAQARVFKMGVFGGVKVNRAAPDRASGTVPVVVDVREAPFRTQKLGVGFGLDQTRNEGRLLAEYTDRNFFGDLRRLTLRGKVGYALLPGLFSLGSSSARKQGLIFDSLVELEQPRFVFRDVRLQTSLGFERDIQPAYQYYGGRAKLGVIWQPHPDFSVYPSYNFEGYGLEGTALPGGSSPALVLGCRSADPSRICYLTLSYLEQVIEWDRRDDRIAPRKGFYMSLSFQEGGGPLGGVFKYVRILPDVRYYKSFFDNRLTMAFKLRVGTLIPGLDPETGADQDSPIVSRFFSGGNFMRGFGDRRLSPLQVVPAQEDGTLPQTVPVGGNALFEGSVEARYALTEKLMLATFLDTGFVTERSFELINPRYIPQNLQYAAGIGMRYLTVVGPIRIDLAYRFAGPSLPTKTDSSIPTQVHNGCFGLFEDNSRTDYPGSPEGLCAFHFSIGEAF